MVISGGNFRPDVLKPKEVVSLLLDDDEMEKKCKSSLAFGQYHNFSDTLRYQNCVQYPILDTSFASLVSIS